MRIVVIGATGTIGSEIADALDANHEVVRAHRHGDVKVDLDEPDSIRDMYEQLGELDAVVCAAGIAKFGKLGDLRDADFGLSMRSKLMGQVNLVRYGRERLRDGGSFTLTSGVLAQHPMPGTSAVAMVNGGVESFARAAALELERGLRINVVSPGWVKETMESMGMDSSSGTAARDVAQLYVQAIEGEQTGEVLHP
jgi:NAD(P)-dependent dehydrogenase (short-subunit alcohol dehydrogenase family)